MDNASKRAKIGYTTANKSIIRAPDFSFLETVGTDLVDCFSFPVTDVSKGEVECDRDD